LYARREVKRKTDALGDGQFRAFGDLDSELIAIV
jgi:hypothetical protein